MKHHHFTHQYSLSKTLRFELKPVGETADYIDEFKSEYLKDVVKQDENRAKDYEIIKEIIDGYHRAYIDEKLSAPCDQKTGELFIAQEDFENAFSYFEKFRINPRDEENKNEWNDTQKNLRKKLVRAFAGNNRLFSKELIKTDLPVWLKAKGEWDENKEAIENFNKFTTYFTGFHENRKNMYTDKDQSTAIAYRLMNENLPRFFNNCILFGKIREKYTDLVFSKDTSLLEKMGVASLGKIFQPGYYINLFTQTDIENYQELLGGSTDEEGSKKQGLNEQINLYRQQKNMKAREVPNFTGLYKQILSDRESHSFVLDAFENDKQLLDTLKKYIKKAIGKDGLVAHLEKSIEKLKEADTNKTYIMGKRSLTDISQKMFSSFGIIPAAVRHYAETIVFPTPKNGVVTESLEDKRDRYTNQDTFSISELESMLLDYIDQLDADDSLKGKIAKLENPKQPIFSYFCSALESAKEKFELNNTIEKVKPLLELEELNKNRTAPKTDNDKGAKGFQQVQKIQRVMDAFMSLIYALKPLHLVKGRKQMDIPDVDTGFYADFSDAFEFYSQKTIGLYNKIRNHLTKKPFLTDKIKINFENPNLLSGWDANKEKDNSAILLEKDGNYYLAIMHPKHKRLFDYIKGIDDINSEKRTKEKNELYDKITSEESDCYQKIVYKLLPGANKMLPKVFFSKLRFDLFSPSDEVLNIRNTASHSKNGAPQKGYEKADFNLQDCHTMIDFFKASIEKHPEWREFGFNFSPTTSYEDLIGFYREVEHQGYRMDFHPIKESYIDECVAERKLFLFQIYNKDFSPYSKGKPSLHTLYWKALFEPENLKDVVAKLNGEAEVFYRKHSIKRNETFIHSAKNPIKNKNKNNPKRESTFDYDIIKNRRYTKDKFLFHVPITLNFKADGVPRFNDRINQELAVSANTHIIGIDRGERHLLYYTVINPTGDIVEQGTLNEISTDQGYNVDYNQ
ncbi:MAG: type V CRISPR-associated protein Cas12a/Cpf1, partial [Candidatus Marinimicrobia bacterium]|nr:type V CRISPR-associated protein Cas12a/Cpf1 [Candidatus Neomarinimicrobiota bacterium]